MDFFLAFNAIHKATLTEKIIEGGFREAGLLPFNPEYILIKLDIKLRTPIPDISLPIQAEFWDSQTPRNSIQAVSQSTLIKNRVIYHQGSCPTPILTIINLL